MLLKKQQVWREEGWQFCSSLPSMCSRQGHDSTKCLFKREFIHLFLYVYIYVFLLTQVNHRKCQTKQDPIYPQYLCFSCNQKAVKLFVMYSIFLLFSFQLKYFMFCNNFSPHIIDVMLCWNNECGYFYKYPDGYYDIHDTLNIFKFVPLEVFLIKYVYKKLNRGNKNPSICIFVSYATLLI